MLAVCVMCWFIIHKHYNDSIYFTVLLFCACCFICRLYLHMDFFSFYARPYVFMFLADRINGRAYATVLRLSVCLSVCDVMYCG